MTNRFQVSDSIYENIVLNNTLPSKLGPFNQSHAFDPAQVIQTAEFARLSFIRRHGLAWIVYPAATQTWLEYSIGHWGLARLAELLIQVEATKKRAQRLSFWLRASNLRAEFYLSMLCEGLGCLPLAAALEINEPFRARLTARQMQSQANRTSALILDERLQQTWRPIAKERYGPINTLGNLLRSTMSVRDSVCTPIVCFLLTGNQEYLDACLHTHRQHAGFVRDLVRGLLFLRKIDHYARDSYISTLRQFGRDLRGFLQAVVLAPDPAKDGIGVTSISDLAMDSAAGLFVKRRHRSSPKDHAVEVIALHEMANWALRAHCDTLSEPEVASLYDRIVFMEDDQVLELLGASSHKPTRIIAQRIRAAAPYALVGKWENTGNIKKAIELVTEYNENNQDTDILPKLLTHYVEGNGSEKDNCFSISKIRIGNESSSLAEHPRYKNNVAYLEMVSKQGCLYVFSKEPDTTRVLRAKIQESLAS